MAGYRKDIKWNINPINTYILQNYYFIARLFSLTFYRIMRFAELTLSCSNTVATGSNAK